MRLIDRYLPHEAVMIDRYLMRLAMIDRYEGHVTLHEGPLWRYEGVTPYYLSLIAASWHVNLSIKA